MTTTSLTDQESATCESPAVIGDQRDAALDLRLRGPVWVDADGDVAARAEEDSWVLVVLTHRVLYDRDSVLYDASLDGSVFAHRFTRHASVFTKLVLRFQV